MDTLNFAISIVLIITSGALAPGPLFFQTISQVTKIGAHSGLIFAIALTVFEFSLIM
jgi:threonine/homoserine/homoserine lactone efflux protein